MIGADILGERARLTPDKTALVEVASGRRYSYAELDARAMQTARAWRQGLGLAKGDRLGLLASNRVEYVDAFFAAPKSGVVLVPIGTRLTAREIEHVVSDSGMRGLIYDGCFVDTVRELRQRVSLEHWIGLDQTVSASDLTQPGLLESLPDAPWSPERGQGEDLHALLYTSGTTGRPKGVIVPQRMVSWNGYNTVCCWQLREDDVSPIFTPLYHAGALGAFLVPIFTIGGTIILHRGFDTSEIWRTIEAEGCTVVLGVPTIYKMLMEAPEFPTVDLSRVRWLISGGAPLPHYIIEAYQRRGVAFKQGYGLTEVGVNCFSMTVEESVRKKGSIGKPLMFTQARLADPDGDEVPTGEVGELLLRGPHVCAGYWQDPEASRAARDDGGWFHTGDLARRDEEGFHYIAGRAKDMLISGGVNIYPAEIEGELLLHPGVQDAAVVGVPSEQWGEVGVAFVVLRAEPGPRTEELGTFLEQRLARYKVPKEFQFVESLPRTPYGKIVKRQLREDYLKSHPSQVGPTAEDRSD